MTKFDEYAKALAEIERLRAALTSIAKNTCCDGCQEAAKWAKAALVNKQPSVNKLSWPCSGCHTNHSGDVKRYEYEGLGYCLDSMPGPLTSQQHQ